MAHNLHFTIGLMGASWAKGVTTLQAHPELSRVILAIDAFADGNELWGKILLPYVLRLAKPRLRAVAAYVMTPKGTSIPAKEFPQWLEFSRKASISAIEEIVRPFERQADFEIEVLPIGRNSHRHSVERLLEYATTSGAEAIVLTTHARGGVGRLFMGSFAETLLLHSRIPCLVVSPSTKLTSSIRRILFPTDFSRLSRSALEFVLVLAARLKAEVTLFYGAEALFTVLRPPGAISAQSTDLEAVHARKVAEEWKGIATHAGVHLSIEIASVPGNVGDTINHEIARFACDLVVMDTRVPRSSAIAMGSTVRRVIRHADCPVLTIPRLIEGEEVHLEPS